jgi:radical S-adenosyl methionine domain-containing protein 2
VRTEFHDSALDLVINWHLIEACNFACSYCFAHWDKPGSVSQAVRNAAALFDQIAGLAGRQVETATGAVDISSVRLNFAGGEPFLVKSIGELVDLAQERGLSPSFISNGALINQRFIDRHAMRLSMAGFSFDAVDPAVMRRIGRADKRGGTLTLCRLAELTGWLRAANPAIKVKLNTVVCAENHGEDLRTAIELIRPDRWKVLRVLPGNGGDPISDEAFASFVARHRGAPNMVVEDNQDMKGSYLMIDPQARFFQNTPAAGYLTSLPILEVGIEAALRHIPFHADRFAGRYVA